MHHIWHIIVYWVIEAKFNQFRNIYSYVIFLKKNEIMKKRCSSNGSNLQARMNFLQISKPAGNWWEHLFWGTAREVVFIN